MSHHNRIVLTSDHSAIALRQAIGTHLATKGWEPVDIGPTTPESTHYPQHGEAAALRISEGDCRLGIILCGTGQGIMMAANKVKGIRCGVCSDPFSARMIRAHNDAQMLAIGARVVGEGSSVGYCRCIFGGRFRRRPPWIAGRYDQGDGRLTPQRYSPSLACTSSRSISPIGILFPGFSKSYLNRLKSRL